MKLGFFVGRVGGDAETTFTPQGVPVTKFSLAIDNGKDKDGNKKNATWVKCAIWRERGEKLQPHIKKGIVVAVTGEVDCRAWTDKQSGDARCQMELNVDKFTFGGSSNQSNSEREEPAARPATPPYDPQNSGPITDEDIPF